MELPSNKTDSCINILFNYLDLSIIIKIVFKLLAERSVVLIGSEPTVLNSIISALKSLIFPIKWLYKCYHVLPKDHLSILRNINLREQTVLAGVLSKDKQDENLKQFAKKQFAVDCDINEIFSDKKYVNFCFLPCSDFVTESRVYMELFNKKLFRTFPFDNTRKRKKLLFLKQGKVVINCEDNNKLVTEHNDFYLSHMESVNFRRKIQKLKQHNFFQSNNEIGIESLMFQGISHEMNHHVERSFEYQLKKVFMELIISKIKTGDPLFEDMKHYKIYFNYIEKGLFDNYAPYNIAKIVNNSSNDDMERCYDNAFKININIKSLENTKYNQDIFGGNNQQIFEDYIKTVNELKSKENDDTWNCDIENIKDTNNVINFYGEDGVISILNNIFAKIGEDKLEQFLLEQYSSQIFKYLFNDFNKENENNVLNEEHCVMSFDVSDLEKQSQYLNYMAVLFDEFRMSSFENEITVNEKEEHKINKDNKGKHCVENILKYYEKAIKLDKVDFPYWKLFQILNSFSDNECNIVENIIKEMDNDIIKIYEDVKQKKNIK